MKALMFLLVFLFTSSAQADFLPENNLHLMDNLDAEGGTTEEEFNAVIAEAKEFYGSIFEGHDVNLVIIPDWESSVVNASAFQSGDDWKVRMFGGLARREEVTRDGFALVLCHEIGHHLAGFPKYARSWAATEGQSDYFSTLSCARNLWRLTTERNEKAEIEIGAYPRQLCDDAFAFGDQNSANICYRSMLAGQSLANLLAALGGADTPSFGSIDINVVPKTSGSHPAAQCRLDSYVAGALCQSDFDLGLIPKSEKIASENSCHILSNYRHGLRPRCWFKPSLLGD